MHKVVNLSEAFGVDKEAHRSCGICGPIYWRFM